MSKAPVSLLLLLAVVACSKSEDGGGPQACPADKPLGGRIEIETGVNENGCRGSVRTVLRFPLDGKTSLPWADQLRAGIFSAPEVSYESSTGGCSGMTSNNEETCNAPSARSKGKLVLGKMGPQGLIEEPNTLGYVTFYPVKPQISVHLDLDSHYTASTPLECVGPSSSGKGIWQYGFQEPLSIEPKSSSCTPDPEDRGLICIEQSRCSDPADESSRLECITHADRYAVIPFAGESRWTSPKASDPYYSGFVSSTVHWKICCGCAEDAAPPEPAADRCPTTLEADSRLETNRKKRKEILAELEKVSATYEEQFKEAEAHYADYAKTVKACLVQTLATKAMIALLAPELAPELEGSAAIPHEVEAAIEWAEENGLFPPMGMQLIAKIIEKILNGEDPTTALKKEGSQNWSETIAVLKKVETLMSDATVADMEKSLDECQGAFLVSAETKLSADKSVESFKAALESLAEFDRLANDIRQLDVDYPDLQYKGWAACVERARCQSTPESACADKKPPGDWPDVP